MYFCPMGISDRKSIQIRLFQVIPLVLISLILVACMPIERISKTDPVQQVIREARSYTGVPYKWGGTSRKGLDCSGLISCAYKPAGISLPHGTESLIEAGVKIKLTKVQPGDLLFFALSDKKKKVSHVGMVTQVRRGSVTFIHASTRGGVMESVLSDDYYKNGFLQARRIIQ
jgi:probable lipoprotein NlpC